MRECPDLIGKVRQHAREDERTEGVSFITAVAHRPEERYYDEHGACCGEDVPEPTCERMTPHGDGGQDAVVDRVTDVIVLRLKPLTARTVPCRGLEWGVAVKAAHGS
jgi:hypothetical protein